MGFLKKLFGVGATAAATVAAVRISDKYKQNNPNGVGDLNGDGVVDTKDVVIGVKNAAKEVYEEAVGTVKEKAPEFSAKAEAFVGEVVEDVKAVATEVKEEMQDVFSDVKQAASEMKEEAAEMFHEAKDTVVDAAEDAAETAAAASEEETPIL